MSTSEKREIDLSISGVEKELKTLPIDKALAFLHSLSLVAVGIEPELKIEHLTTVAPGVIELKINGSPAYRCVYHNKIPGKVVVLRFFKKTTNGVAKHDLDVARKRLKQLKL